MANAIFCNSISKMRTHERKFTCNACIVVILSISLAVHRTSSLDFFSLCDRSAVCVNNISFLFDKNVHAVWMCNRCTLSTKFYTRRLLILIIVLQTVIIRCSALLSSLPLRSFLFHFACILHTLFRGKSKRIATNGSKQLTIMIRTDETSSDNGLKIEKWL